ncbi:MAG TPA: hypothetical protein VGK73_24150, partial [Polyangiaceae bacterium]
SLPEIRAMRPEFAALQGFDLARFDKLRDYALAVGHAHAMYRAAAGPNGGLAELAEEVMELRDMLQADATALAKRRILDENQVSKLRGGSGYKTVAFEVVGLVGLLRERWNDVKNRSALQPEELEHAGRRAQELVTAVGLREQSPAMISAAAATRQRAYTLFFRAYEDVRRALSYLRWHENGGDSIAPSLFVGRGGRTVSDEVTTSETVQSNPPPANVPSQVVPAANAVPLPAAAGLPGSSPFTRS